MKSGSNLGQVEILGPCPTQQQINFVELRRFCTLQTVSQQVSAAEERLRDALPRTRRVVHKG